MSWTTVAPWWCFAAVISECFRFWGHLQLTRWCRSEYCSQYSRLAEGSPALWGSDAAGHLPCCLGHLGIQVMPRQQLDSIYHRLRILPR